MISAKQHSDRLQFLPAALAVQETPPAPTGRWLLYTILLLFVSGIAWASMGEVDIVVTAPGRVIPSGQVKLVQAPETATVVDLLASEGLWVAAGQALVKLDTTFADADELSLREKLHAVAVESAWRSALERWLADGRPAQANRSFPIRFAAADQSRAELLYRLHRREITDRLLSHRRELAATRAEQAALQAELNRAQSTLAVLVQRVAAYKSLLDQQYGAKVQYLEMLQQQTELDRSIPVLESRQRQKSAAAAALAATLNATTADVRRQNLMELARLGGERAALEQELLKANQYREKLVLTAPVTGTVQELKIHTVGAVVTPAEILMKIVPEQASIEVEAMLQNKDIGFVDDGQAAEVKVDAFNFTKYGLIAAKLINISNDAVEDQQLGWVFKLRLELEREDIAVEGKSVKLIPGMAVTAEIKTGKRRLIEYFLSPLLRYQQESVRER